MAEEKYHALKPEFILPIIGVLSHESCPETG
jgi:hypothetical protein